MKTMLLLIALCGSASAGETVLAFGDSVTACTPPPAGSCPFGETETFRYKLATAIGATVINGGISGDSSEDALLKLSPLLSTNSPTIVVIMFGLNDEAESVSVSVYERNLITFVRQCRTFNKRMEIILMTPNATRDYQRNQRLKPYVIAVRDVAKRFNTKIVDNYRAYAEYATESALGAGLMTNLTYDTIHPNENGQTVISNRIIECLMLK